MAATQNAAISANYHTGTAELQDQMGRWPFKYREAFDTLKDML